MLGLGGLVSAGKRPSWPQSTLTLNEQQVANPFAQGPTLWPARRVHSLSDKQVPESCCSPWHGVFWNLTIASRAGRVGRPPKVCARLGSIMATKPRRATIFLYIVGLQFTCWVFGSKGFAGRPGLRQ